MSYEPIQERIDFEEAKLAKLIEDTKVTQELLKDLKKELSEIEPEKLLKTRKSDLLPLVEVREDEDGGETLIFTDGYSTKLHQVRKPKEEEEK
ncbi:hypothetical protein [Arthrobacter sp. Soil762]|uniref:hypothetical protein n=1 Tax=Arthrobacter sp. Soil762 TaxID=1736401 RepID=UPI0006F2A35B|nr:hypothetical protein [Arthrobacter sp. Soil762]KRE76095.1 hypothetical protein ASG77_20155 [Arthrobacter sp. Soil762]